MTSTTVIPSAAAERAKRNAARPAWTPSARDLLHRAGQRADDDFTERAGTNLTSRQWCVLAALATDEGCSQTALVEVTGVDRSTLADIVRRMQRNGLVQRKRTKEDARTYAVKLTDEGRRVLRAAGPLSRESDAHLMAALTVKEQHTFLALLGRVAKGVNHG